MNAMADMMVSGGLSATFGASLSVVSRVVRIIAQNKALSHARDIEEMKVLASLQDGAFKRDNSKTGQWIRRFIVISLFGFVTWLLWINGMFQHFAENGVPATYAYMEQTEPRWFGLVAGRQVLRTVPLSGVPVFDTIVNMCWLIGSFYFGSSRIK